MQVDFRLLEAFKAVIDARSVTAAAKMLGVSQPAVSAQIAKLEEEVGFRLFDRDGGRLKPTKEGRSFYEAVAKALANVSHIQEVAETIKRGGLGSLAIASHPSAGISFLPTLVAEFLQAHPGVAIRLVTRNSEIVRGLFPSQLYDIGIAELPFDYAGVETTKYRLRCVAALPKGHALAAHKTITPKLLSGLPFFAVSRERPTHHAIAKAFADAHAEFNLVGEAELFAAVSGVVVAGGAVAVIDPWTAMSFGSTIEVRPFEPLIPYDIGVFHSADRRPSKIAAEFMKRLDRSLRDMGSAGQRVRSRP
jgi:DNA-binding transcriptional LysR family regulator